MRVVAPEICVRAEADRRVETGAAREPRHKTTLVRQRHARAANSDRAGHGIRVIQVEKGDINSVMCVLVKLQRNVGRRRAEIRLLRGETVARRARVADKAYRELCSAVRKTVLWSFFLPREGPHNLS